MIFILAIVTKKNLVIKGNNNNTNTNNNNSNNDKEKSESTSFLKVV